MNVLRSAFNALEELERSRMVYFIKIAPLK